MVLIHLRLLHHPFLEYMVGEAVRVSLYVHVHAIELLGQRDCAATEIVGGCEEAHFVWFWCLKCGIGCHRVSMVVNPVRSDRGGALGVREEDGGEWHVGAVRYSGLRCEGDGGGSL